MQCPIDSTTLDVVTRSGIQLDVCPTCRGVWFERGEVDELLAREQRRHVDAFYLDGSAEQPSRGWDDDEYRAEGRPSGRRRRGLLSDLLDF
jgi:Zn-finger nucleic acid-binding protein